MDSTGAPNREEVFNKLFPQNNEPIQLVPRKVGALSKEVTLANERTGPYDTLMGLSALITIGTCIVTPMAWIVGLQSLKSLCKWMGGSALITVTTVGSVFCFTNYWTDHNIVKTKQIEAWTLFTGTIKKLKQADMKLNQAVQERFGETESEPFPKTEAALQKVADHWNKCFADDKTWSSIYGVIQTASVSHSGK